MDNELLHIWFAQAANRLSAPRQSCHALATMALDKYGDGPEVWEIVKALRHVVFSFDMAHDTFTELESRPEPEAPPEPGITPVPPVDGKEPPVQQMPRPRSAGEAKDLVRQLVAGMREEDRGEVLGELGNAPEPAPVGEASVIDYLVGQDDDALMRIHREVNTRLGVNPEPEFAQGDLNAAADVVCQNIADEEAGVVPPLVTEEPAPVVTVNGEPAKPADEPSATELQPEPVWTSPCGRAIIFDWKEFFRVTWDGNTLEKSYKTLNGAKSAARSRLQRAR